MLDGRTALKPEYQLRLNTETEYKIAQEVGRGAGCIVYDASYADNREMEHKVRIKECYPYSLKLTREEDGRLSVSKEEKDKFEKEKEKFIRAYKRNTQLGNTLGLINSTVNVSNIYDRNDTVYIVMNYDEGTDYSQWEDQDLESVFIIIRAVAEIIGKYHENGFLHLDIKPENIMVIPETREHVILLDFDSMIAKEELKSENLQLSFSDGFSAPEQVHGEVNKITEATDIYSLGALMFYKIFGRKPESSRDCILGAEFDFSNMKYLNGRYSQVLFRKLEEFLHKTLSISVVCRWEKIEQVLQSLDELIRLADFKHLFLQSNFYYNTGCFVGRRKELGEIKSLLSKHQVLFLHGIGGIGKTELAKRFLYENKSDFRHIIFISFQGSILETVTGSEIKIENFRQEKEEDQRCYFNRKIEVLKSVLSVNDIILLDNFDISDDDELETLLECPCKFIVTTREDFRDYNYPQIDIHAMEETEEIWNLFFAYNTKKYQNEELLCIKEMIDFVEGHTMTVELLAKYLRDSMETVYSLKEKLWENKGITSVGNIDIRHRKDGKRYFGNIPEYLLMLFQISDFSEKECELMKSLSLLGYVQINKKVFLNYCNCMNAEGVKNIDHLIRKGWIEYEEPMDKISLHQVILDLVYNYFKPTSESCPAITSAMTEYACMEMGNKTEREIRKKVLKLFSGRISGADDRLAEFYLSYCIHIRNEESLLDKIQEICSVSESRKHFYLLCLAYMQKIKAFAVEHRWWMETDGGSLNEFADQIAESAGLCIEYMEKMELGDADRARVYAEVGALISNEMGRVEFYIFEEDEKCCLDRVYIKAQEFLEKAAVLMENNGFIPEEKIKVYEELIAFYQVMDFSATYRSEHYGDSEKILYFSSKIEEERRRKLQENGTGQDGDFYVRTPEISYEECADDAAFQEDHDHAIQYYKKALEISENEIEMTWILSKLAKEYEKMEAYQEAENCLLDKLKMEEKMGRDISYTCDNIVDLFIKYGDNSEALQYCEKAIKYQEQKLRNKEDGNLREDNEEDFKENKLWLIAFYGKKYAIGSEEEKEYCYKKCMEYYQYCNGKDYDIADSRVLSFLEVMYRRELEEGKKDKIIVTARKILDVVKKYLREWEYHCAERMVSLLLHKEGRKVLNQSLGRKETMEILAEALCYRSDIYRTEDKQEKALECCLKAEEILYGLNKEQEPLFSFILARQGEIYGYLGEYEKGEKAKKQCNYYLIAKEDEKEKGIDLEQKLSCWEDAADAYFGIDNYADAERCFRQWFALFEPVLGQYSDYSFENYQRMALKRIRGLLKQELFEEVYRWNTELYLKVAEDYQKKVILVLQAEEQEKTKEWNKIRENFCWILEQIAENYNRAFYHRQAIIIYFVKLAEAAEKEREEKIDLEQIGRFDKREEKNVIESVIRILKREDILKHQVDTIVDVFEKVKMIGKEMKIGQGEENEWFEKVIEQYKKFTEVYQYGEIKFKR